MATAKTSAKNTKRAATKRAGAARSTGAKRQTAIVDLTAATTPAPMRAALAKLGKTALQEKYKEVFGEQAKSDNVHHLRQALAKKLFPKPAPSKNDNAAEDTLRRVRDRDARLPPAGTVIERPYNGVTHKVKVLADAFEFAGKRHRSLSGVAKSITGQPTNGFLWFGLVKGKDKPKGGEVRASKRATTKSTTKKAKG